MDSEIILGVAVMVECRKLVELRSPVKLVSPITAEIFGNSEFVVAPESDSAPSGRGIFEAWRVYRPMTSLGIRDGQAN